MSTLSNGLTVVTVAMPHLHSAHISLFCRAGSRHESPETNGLSHFLEHMFFRGCDGYPDSTSLNAAMEDLGGYLDGYTTRDYSGYESVIHPQFLKEGMEVLGQMFLSPHFNDIDTERSIILEELLDALDERGKEIDIDTIAHRHAFKDHNLGQSIDGPRANIRRLDREDLIAHRDRLYGAKNLVLCLAGRVDPKEARRWASKYFGKLPAGRLAKEGPAPKLPAPPRRLRYVFSDEPQTRARFSFRITSDKHRDYPALLLLRRLLDGGLSSRLQVELVEKRGLAYEIGADLLTYADCGLLDFEFAVAHRKLPETIGALAQVLADVRSAPVEQAELDRLRRRVRIGYELKLDSTADLSHWYGAVRLFRPPMEFPDRLQQLEAITPKQLHRVTKRYLHPDRLTVAAVGGAETEQVRAARAAVREFNKSLD